VNDAFSIRFSFVVAGVRWDLRGEQSSAAEHGQWPLLWFDFRRSAL
jgi:hypothetical protein